MERNPIIGQPQQPAIRRMITEEAHGFTVGQVIEPDGGAWILSPADSESAVRALIVRVMDDDRVLAVFDGAARLTDIPADDYTLYVIDPDNDGDVIPVGDLAEGATRTPIYYSLVGGWVVVGSTALGGGSVDQLTLTVTQAAHGFGPGLPVMLTDSGWEATRTAYLQEHGDITGLIIAVPGENTFEVLLRGVTAYEGATMGTLYFISDDPGILIAAPEFPAFGIAERALMIGVGDAVVYVFPPAQMVGHSHPVEDGAVRLAKLEGSPGAYILGNDGTDEEDESVKPLTLEAFLGEGAAASVYGRSADSAGERADIVAEVDDRFLGRRAGALGFFQVAWGDLDLTGAALPVGGDLDDTTDNATVVGIHGVPVSSATPNEKDFLVLIDGEWTYQQVLGLRGDIFIRGASETEALHVGAAGTLLSSDGTDPSWSKTISLGSSSNSGGSLAIWHTSTESTSIAADGTVTLIDGAILQWPSLHAYMSDSNPGEFFLGGNNGSNWASWLRVSGAAMYIGENNSGTKSITFGGSAVTNYTFNASTGTIDLKGSVIVAAASRSLGFFGSAGTTKQTVADMGALATTETADSTYSTNEVNMLNNLKADVTSLRTKLNALLDALQAYGQIGS